MTRPDASGDDQSGPAGGPGRDERLSWFASGGRYDRGRPDAEMAGALEAVAGPSGRPPAGASDDEVAGMLGGWQALEAHAHARMLAAVREVIRRRVPAGEAPAVYPGDLPRRWDTGVAHEIAAELRLSWQAAEPLVHLAWELEARLPGAGRLLDGGVLTALKARIITDELAVLDDDTIAQAEKLLLEHDLAADGMTPGRLRKLCQRIADTVDPEGARERREDAARDRARVSFFRAHGGDTALFAEGLPPDEALKCQGNVQARAADYKKAMVYPEAGMDFLRVLALVDLINGASLDDRIARYHAEDAAAEDARNAGERARDQETAESLARHRPPPPGTGIGGSPGRDATGGPGTGNGGSPGRDGTGGPGTGCGGNGGSGGPEYGWPDDEDDPQDCRDGGDDPDKPEPPVPGEEPPGLDDCDFWPGFGPVGGTAGGTGRGHAAADSEDGHAAHDGQDGDGEDGDGTGRGGSAPPCGPGPGGTGSSGAHGGTRDPGLPALAHLTLPLATLLHLGERPGEASGYGSIDPGLVRDFGRAAAASPRTRFCLTITDEHGHAAAHGCARLLRESDKGNRETGSETGDKRRNGQAEKDSVQAGKDSVQAGKDSVQAGKGTGPPGGSRDSPAASGWSLTPDDTRPGPGGGHGTWSLTVPGGRRYRLDLHTVPTHDCDHRYATNSYRPGAMLRHLVEVRDGECTFTGCSHPASRCDFEHAVPYDQGGATCACNTGARSRRCHRVKQSRGWTLTQPEPGLHTWTTPSGRSYTKKPKTYPD